MGNLCSKSANQSDNFSGPGRQLGSANESEPASAPIPKQVTASSPGRALGGRDGAQSPDDARGAAAKAAEARAVAGAKIGAGKLSANLAAQKKQTQNQLLGASSEQERRARDADSTAESQAYN
ncbi:hypothetical protein DV736_g2944, partial [Chaetothyriales sp. CBS 134916]